MQRGKYRFTKDFVYNYLYGGEKKCTHGDGHLTFINVH